MEILKIKKELEMEEKRRVTNWKRGEKIEYKGVNQRKGRIREEKYELKSEKNIERKEKDRRQERGRNP